MRANNISGLRKHWDFVLVDFVSLIIAFTIAYYLKFENFGFIDSGVWKSLLALMLLVNLMITLAINPYSGIFRRRYWEDVGTQLVMTLECFLVICVFFYLLKIGEDYSREMLIVTYAIYITLALLLKYFHKRHLLSRWNNRPPDSVRKLVLVTKQDCALDEEDFVYADDLNSNAVVGFCFVDAREMVEYDDRPAAPIDCLVELCAKVNADDVLILVDPSFVGGSQLEGLMEDGVVVRFGIAQSIGVPSEVQSIGHVGVIKTLDLKRHSFGSAQVLYLPLKRLTDIAIGFVGSIVMLPIAAVVKVSYLLAGDFHPVFYSQTRIGQRGKPFKLWKLRSMVWNADEVLRELLKDPVRKQEWDAAQKLSDDPRITRLGAILRRTSLDELPQFFNILRGDMSVVGPRPLVPGELEAHGGRPLYNKVKPGLTGWWGCNGRSNIEYYERLELEYYYVTHCSLYLDALCVLRTAIAVFKTDGAQ